MLFEAVAPEALWLGVLKNLISCLFPVNVAHISVFVFLSLSVCFCVQKRESREVLVGLLFLAFPFIPASNLFFRVGFVVAERVLYMPR